MSISLISDSSLIYPELRLRQSPSYSLRPQSFFSYTKSSSLHQFSQIVRPIKLTARSAMETKSGGVPNNTMKLLFVEMGVGYDQHGQDVTSAAMKACKNAISSDIDGENQTFKIRRLEISDKKKGYIELLGQLTVTGTVTDEEFDQRFEEISPYGDDHVICVIEDEASGRLAATGSVMIEKKFLRNCGKVGHIEDVVVDSKFRGKQLGKKVVEFLVDHCKSMGCYKVILNCSVDKKVFYEKCGLTNKGIQMCKYFD